jgi:hypothetical protein
MADFVAEVGHLVAAGVPDRLLAVHGVERAVAFAVELDVIEDEKLGFRTEDGGVRQTGGSQILFGSLRDSAGIPVVGFLGTRFRNGARQRKRRGRAKRINERRCRIRHGQHVGGLDGLPSADRRAVETKAVLENLFCQLANRDTEVLPGPKGVHEFNVHHLGALFFRHVNRAFRGRGVAFCGAHVLGY